VIALMLGLAAAAAQPGIVATIDPSHRIVEGVATDGSTIWVTSVLDRQVIACTKNCRTIATLKPGLHPFALAWDWRRKLLWVAADCPPGVPGIVECRQGALVALSRTGKVRAMLAPKDIAFHPGDVSVSRSGVFASDSQNGLVWRLMPGRPGLRAVNRPGDGKSAQGTALEPSGTALIVAEYSRGIGSIDLKTTATTWLPRQDGKPLRGVDGLIRCGDTYLGVYNGQTPGAILTITMRPGGVEYGELVADLVLPDPTQIAFDGKRLLAVADSGWEAHMKGQANRQAGAHIVAIPLSSDCKPI
jgi:hypothetical protein